MNNSNRSDVILVVCLWLMMLVIGLPALIMTNPHPEATNLTKKATSSEQQKNNPFPFLGGGYLWSTMVNHASFITMLNHDP